MSRDWQPGDVARVTYGRVDEIALVRPRRGTGGRRLEFAYASCGFDLVDDPNVAASARRLVVIDPDDREAVERLAQAYYSAEASSPIGTGVTPNMQAALHEFANPKPPKPEEPMGLGAVVEAIHDNRFVHVGGGLWRRVSCGDGDAEPCRYADIAAVRVLSEGVPDA